MNPTVVHTGDYKNVEDSTTKVLIQSTEEAAVHVIHDFHESSSLKFEI
jgi:hypothetical protein